MCSKFLILAVCLCVSVSESSQTQDKLIQEQIQRIFHCNPTEVPNNEAVIIQTKDVRRSKRDIRPIEFEIDGKVIQLNLNLAEHNSVPSRIPVWTVESTSQSPYHAFKKLNEEEYKINGTIYHDSQKMATLIASFNDGQIYYNGVFGEGDLAKVIRSVPEKFWWRPDLNSSNVHIVYNVTNVNGTINTISEINLDDTAQTLGTPLDTIYPKLLLIIENNYFKKFGENVSEVMRYLSPFWNAVNLQYNKISLPKVKIMITGVIVVKDDHALEYIYNSRDKTDLKKINTTKLIEGGSRYFKNEFNKYVNFKNYDSTITLVELDKGNVLGTAYPSGICDIESERNVAVMTDDANYGGLLPATHELGHLLGMFHDEQYDIAKNCKSQPEENVSTIMSAFTHSTEKYVWSECSKNRLITFSRSKLAKCLKDQHRS